MEDDVVKLAQVSPGQQIRPGDIVTYAVTLNPDPVALAYSNGTTTYTLVTATNSAGSVGATTPVTITGTGTLPVAQAGLDQTVHTGDRVMLEGSASFDPGHFLPLTYHWQQTGGSPVALGSANNVTVTFMTSAVTQTETLTFALTVTNTQHIASLPDVVVITVELYRVSLPIILK